MTVTKLLKASAPRIGACMALILWASAATAHEMTIEAAVLDDTFVISVGYEDGSIPATARVVISDEAQSELVRMPADAGGKVSIPLSDVSEGAVVEVSDDDGHSTYRIFTPSDLDLLKN